MTATIALEHLAAHGVPEPRVHFDPVALQWEVWSGGRCLATAPLLRSALDRAGYPLDRRSVFSSFESAVMLGDDKVAVARSRTMAKRIVNALNLYNPGDRGF